MSSIVMRACCLVPAVCRLRPLVAHTRSVRLKTAPFLLAFSPHLHFGLDAGNAASFSEEEMVATLYINCIWVKVYDMCQSVL